MEEVLSRENIWRRVDNRLINSCIFVYQAMQNDAHITYNVVTIHALFPNVHMDNLSTFLCIHQL